MATFQPSNIKSQGSSTSLIRRPSTLRTSTMMEVDQVRRSSSSGSIRPPPPPPPPGASPGHKASYKTCTPWPHQYIIIMYVFQLNTSFISMALLQLATSLTPRQGFCTIIVLHCDTTMIIIAKSPCIPKQGH